MKKSSHGFGNGVVASAALQVRLLPLAFILQGGAMLVLSRMRDQIIQIGDDIQVVIVDVRGDKVRVGVNAPNNVTVHRKEVYDAIKREQRYAQRL